MPIAKADPWRMQYFKSVRCPKDVMVRTEDSDAYMLFPKHRWIYNKLQVAESQHIRCAPHGCEPAQYPVFSKPIYNMRGMGAGSRIFASRRDYITGQQPGHMWMELLEGEHVSTDIAAVNGEPLWWRHAVGVSIGRGMFDYWTVEAGRRPHLESHLRAWVEIYLRGYTGMINLETIGGTIIEGHLRFSDQWPDLYGTGWVESLVGLYRDGKWSYADAKQCDGFSVVLFGPYNARYGRPPQQAIEELSQRTGVSSIQITFHENWPVHLHSMPPGGFRLAIVNCVDLAVGQAVRAELAQLFRITPSHHPGNLPAVASTIPALI